MWQRRYWNTRPTFFASKTTAPEPNGKTGTYLPHEVDRQYVWDTDPEFKEYRGLIQKTAPSGPREWMHKAIDDELAFHTCLKTLAQGKATGPDGVANKLLQLLPDEGKKALHNLFRILWATGITPTSWKVSNTILVYKHKGTPLELQYYRCIGLELTVYKLWTRMVTFAMADRAERQGMITSLQAGFRNKRSMIHQLEMMVMLLEDAYWTKQNIYLLQADLTEAFDTISHDKLLWIRYDLGFRTDAVEVVKDLYTGTTTTVQTPYGPTRPLNIDRGTIQGDSLSPFLFIMYMEPLLRWLQAGDKGYMVGAIRDPAVKLQNQISNVSYADDINLITGGPQAPPNLKHQAKKFSRYADWGHLLANNVKTLVTGALHGHQPQQPYDDQTLSQQITGTIEIQGRPITYLSPRKPFRLLGVQMTKDLNFKHQLQQMLKQIREMVMSRKESYASPAQKESVIRTCIRPKITYAMAVALYIKSEIKLLDSLTTRAYKQAAGLPISMPTAAAHLDKQLGGLGCPSLEVEQTVTDIQRITRALNDTGRLGVISRALLDYQRAVVDQLTAQKAPSVMRYTMRLRQLTSLVGCGLTLRKDDAPEDGMQAMLPLAKTVAALLPSENTASWGAHFVQDMHLLYTAGITTLEHMLSPDKTLVNW
jgi:hypothetical protein